MGSGVTDSGNPIKTGAVFNSTLPTVTNGQRVDTQADSNGRIVVNATPVDGTKATYSAAITGLVTAANATDVFTLIGSASKTIRILAVGISITTTSGTGTGVNLSALKRSTANTGGTSATVASVPHDSTNSAATAVARSYTANPAALGTLVGNIRTVRYGIPSSNAIQQIRWEFGDRPGQGIVLRGVAQTFAINLNATSVTGSNTSIFIEWTEE